MVAPATMAVSKQTANKVAKAALPVLRCVCLNTRRVVAFLPVRSDVRISGHNLKILRAIVRPVPVAVVNLFALLKRTTKHLFRNDAMDANLFAIVPLNLIPAIVFPHLNLQLLKTKILHPTLKVNTQPEDGRVI